MKIGKFELLKSFDLHNKSNIRDAIELLNGEFGMIVTIFSDDNNFFWFFKFVR